VHFGPLDLNIYFGLAVGFIAVLVIASALNRFGDAMFKRGVARPFFVGRHRLHHRSFLFVFLPTAYLALSALVLAGYITIVWSLLWTGLAGTLVVAVTCLTFDLLIDYSHEGRGWWLLHHELVYLMVPAYAFSDFLRLVI